jgi:hypothetical protein
MPLGQYKNYASISDAKDPKILDFMEAVGDQGYLDFEVLRQRHFIKFWSNTVINRYENDDFTYIFHGTNLVKNIGVDRTGLTVLGLTNHTHKVELFNILLEIIKTKQTMFTTGHIKIDGREHQTWQQVKMPMWRKGEINEVVSFFAYNPI